MAVNRLLAGLRAGGARLRYHGDFDWAGLAIAADVIAAGERPWRFTAADYRAALAAPHPPLPALGMRPPALQTGWDPALTGVMAAEGAAIEEEHVLDVLLADLAEMAGRPAPADHAGPPER